MTGRKEGGGRARVRKHKTGPPCAYGVDGNQTYCSGHCALYTNSQSLCCTSETNIVLPVNYFSIKPWFLEEEKRTVLKKRRSYFL